jgi:hypothetical protein
MSLLWAVAPVAVAVGLVLGLVGLRRIDVASTELAQEIARAREVRAALEDLRQSTDATRERARRVRRRQDP